MQTATLSSAAPKTEDQDSIESLGLSGATLMQLWSIGVASVSDLTTYNTDSLRKRLIESLNGSTVAHERIEKALVDIQSAMRSRNLALKTVGNDTQAKKDPSGEDVSDRELEEPSHEWLDKANEEIPRIDQDPLQPFYRDMKKYNKLLSREEQNELGRRVLEEKDMKARDLLVLHNLRLVLWVARKHLWSKLELADLVQEGVIGLIIAAEKYDHRQGFAFSTYAHWWVRQIISRLIMDSGFIRIPVHMGELLYKIRRAMNEIAIREGRPPTVDEIAKEVERTPKEVKRALKVGRLQVVSLDETTNVMSHGAAEDGDEVYERIADETVLRADRALEAKEELNAACERLNQLGKVLYEDGTITEKNRDIFVRFYGLEGSLKRRTLEHVAEGQNLTRERVRQIIVACWEKLQAAGVDMDHESVAQELGRIRELEKLTHKRVSAA